MGLFDFVKKKETSQLRGFKMIQAISGPIIDLANEQDRELPPDAQMLYRTGEAHWNTKGCKDLSIRAFHALYQYGLQDQYPKAGYYIAKYAWENKEKLKTEGIDYIKCAAHSCRYYIVMGEEVNMIQEPIILYLNYYPEGLGQVIEWLRERVERERKSQNNPIGILLLRHYLVLRRFADEIKEICNPISYENLVEKYMLREMVVQYVSCQLHFELLTGITYSTEETRQWLKNEAWYDNMMATQIIYGTGLDGIPYQHDESKMDEDGYELNYWASPYREYFSLWNGKVPELKKEVVSLGDGWFEKEVTKADKLVNLAKTRQIERRETSLAYARALCLHAGGNTKAALEIMCQIEAKDTAVNWSLMRRREFWESLSPAASRWIACHSEGIYDRKRQYGYDENGNFARRDTSHVRADAWAGYKLWTEAEELADQIHQKPDDAGFRKLAKLLGQKTPYWYPIPELSQRIRHDLLRKNGEEELIWYLLDEPEYEICKIAEGLIHDPEMNHGDDNRIRIGRLAKVNWNYYHIPTTYGFPEAIEYVNYHFNRPDKLKKYNLNIRHLTKLAVQGDEDTLQLLGELYMNDPTVHQNNELVKNVGQVFLKKLSELYRKAWLDSLKARNEDGKREYMRKWYWVEYVERREAEPEIVDKICIKAIDTNDFYFYPMLTRPGVFQYYMKEKGRSWVKAMLKITLDNVSDNVRELYDKMEKEDQAIERERIAAEQERRRAEERAYEREKKRRQEELDRRMDDRERMWDLINGGMGNTVEEDFARGKINTVDFLKYKNARDNLKKNL